MQLFEECPVVTEEWNKNGSLDLIWLQEHVKNCPHCQQLMNYVNETIMPDLLGSEDENRSL